MMIVAIYLLTNREFSYGSRLRERLERNLGDDITGSLKDGNSYYNLGKK